MGEGCESGASYDSAIIAYSYLSTQHIREQMTPEANTSTVIPAPRSVWQHRDGDIYTVEMLANEHTSQPERYPVTVVYRGQDGKVWSRRLVDWHGSMTALSEMDVARLMLPQEPTLDGSIPGRDVSPVLMFEYICFIRNQLLRAREDLKHSGRRTVAATAVAGVSVLVALGVATGAIVSARQDAKKTQEAVTSLRAVEQTLSGLTDVQAQEVMKRKMLREIRTRAATIAADPEADKHVD